MAVGNVRPRSGWVLPLRILQAMRQVYGHLYDDEAEILLVAAERALSMSETPGTIVEIGSFHGKSTVVFGLVAKAARPNSKVYAVDPHEGELSADDPALNVAPSLEAFTRNIAAAGLTETVVPVRMLSGEVEWNRPIDLLFIDALHDYANVAQDFVRFAPWVVPRGYIAFHDYGKPDFPGVTKFVDEVISLGYGEPVQRAGSVIVIEKPELRSSLRGTPSAGSHWTIDDYWRS